MAMLYTATLILCISDMLLFQTLLFILIALFVIDWLIRCSVNLSFWVGIIILVLKSEYNCSFVV